MLAEHTMLPGKVRLTAAGWA